MTRLIKGRVPVDNSAQVRYNERTREWELHRGIMIADRGTLQRVIRTAELRQYNIINMWEVRAHIAMGGES